MKIIVAFSGGKDSQACLIWAVQKYGFKNIRAVFCDTGWEHQDTYNHIKEITEKLNVELITLRSKKFNGFVDMAKKKGRFPSSQARFCTTELKVKPMIDYILSLNDNVIVIQGIRADESKSRSEMQKQCRYFKYYFESYGTDKRGKPKYHTYRKNEVKEFCKNYVDDVLRPVIDWSGGEVMSYIISNGQKPNPLYYQGVKRVGCYPCIMYSHREIKSMITFNPAYIDRLKSAEQEVKRTFFPPSYIPERYQSGIDEKSGKSIPTVSDVIKYIESKNENLDLFETEGKERSCMSFYNICE